MVEGQRERLSALGVEPMPAEAQRRSAEAVKASGGGRAVVWERSLRAARQYREREGHLSPARAHVETVVDEDGQEHAVKLGVWLSNQRSRRAKLSGERAAALEALGAW